MNDQIENNVEVVDPTLPIVTDTPDTSPDGSEGTVYVAEDTVDVRVED